MEPDRLSRELADRLEAARMTAEALSLDAELARDTVGRWIRGTTVPTLAALRAVEDVLSERLGYPVDLSAAIRERRSARQRDRQRGQAGRRADALSSDDVPGPTSTAGLIIGAYRAQAADIAPDQLLDRNDELTELTRFCGEEQSYAWWQGRPWAGKSALLSWFALHPPSGVDVVSFFIAGRLGQSDSGAFTNALIEQLAILAGESIPAMLGTRHGHVLRLLETVAGRLMTTGRRLLLVVDGLDEDTGISAGSGRASIASLLPRRPPPGIHVLVSSRLSFSLPHDVPGDHPLRMTAPRHLDDSRHARFMENAAKDELARTLRQPGTHDVLGLILASGGGLTIRDLEELTRKARYEVTWQIDGKLSRIVANLVSRPLGSGPGHPRGYAFTHETLRSEAERQYGASLGHYRDQIHGWALGYQARGWPSGTPAYLLNGYVPLLASCGDVPRLLKFATDDARHRRMREATGGDMLALLEIAAATDQIMRATHPDLAALASLALVRDRVVQQNLRTPSGLPIAWAAAGDPGRGLAAAYCLGDPLERAHVLGQIARTCAAIGDHEKAFEAAAAAEATARAITDLYFRHRLLASVAAVWGVIGDRERGTRLASDAEIAVTQDDSAVPPILALCQIAKAWAILGENERAVSAAAAARTRALHFSHPPTISEVAGAWAALGDHGRAAQAAIATEVAAGTGSGSFDAAKAWAAAGDYDTAEQLAANSLDTRARDHAYRELADILCASGEPDRAERLARASPASTDKAVVLSIVAQAWAARGDLQRAAKAASEAEAVAASLMELPEHTDALTAVATAWAAAGDLQRAVQAATEAEAEAEAEPDNKPAVDPEILAKTAQALASAGDLNRAEQLTMAIGDHRLQFETLIALAEASAAAGERSQAVRALSKAETIAGEADDPAHDLSTHGTAYPGWVDGRPLNEITAAARAWIAFYDQADIDDSGTAIQSDDSMLAAIAQKEAGDGEFHKSEQTAHNIQNILERTSALAHVAMSTAAAGNHEHAMKIAEAVASLAEDLTDPALRVQALCHACEAYAAAGNNDHAMQAAQAAETALEEFTAAQHPNPEAAQQFLIHVTFIMARAWSLAKDHTHAVQAATSAESAAAGLADAQIRAQALADASAAWVAVGEDQCAARAMTAAQAELAEVTQPGIRILPLLRVAQILGFPEVSAALARSQYPGILSADQLLAQMISTSDWASREAAGGIWLWTLPVMGKVNLSSLQRFGDQLLTRLTAPYLPTGNSQRSVHTRIFA